MAAPKQRNANAEARVSDFAAAVFAAVARIPRGRVTSYGAIAALIGRPRSARAVGAALRSLPDSIEVPWWRVINGRGAISRGGNLHRDHLQHALLERERVQFDGTGRIDLARYGWQLPDEAD